MNKFRNNYKKVTSLLLIIIMLFSCVSFAYPSAFAAGTEYTKDGYTYTVSGANATIVAYTTSSSGKITIPSKLNGYTVTTIGARAFYACTKLTEIIIPNTVTKIEDYAFSMCFDLITCKIPSSVKSIGKDIFSFNDEVVIECEEGSVAWQYAKDNEITVKDNDAETQITFANESYETTVGEEFAISGTAKCSEGIDKIDLTWTCSNLNGLNLKLPASELTVSETEIIFSVLAEGLEAGEYVVTVSSGDEAIAQTRIHVSENSENEGLTVFTNNLSMTYYVGDTIVFPVTIMKDDMFELPTNLLVSVADSNILKFDKIFTHKEASAGSMIKIELDEKIKNCKFVVFKANSEGATQFKIADSGTGENKIFTIKIIKDKYGSLRADQLKPKEFSYKIFGSKIIDDYYYAYINGLWVSDFECKSSGDQWVFKMNIFNERYSIGVVEVFDSKGKLKEVEKIDKYISSTGRSLKNTFEGGWNMLKDSWNGDLLSFRSSTTAVCTPIEVKVPRDGFIRITNDSAVSTTCYLYNLLDIVLTAGDVISGSKKLTVNQVDIFEKKALAKFIGSTYYLETADKYKENFLDNIKEGVSTETIEALIKKSAFDLDAFLSDVDLTFGGLSKEFLGTGISIAEELFLMLTGPAGQALNIMFNGTKICDYILQANNWAKTTNVGGAFGIVAPRSDYEGGLIQNENISVNINDSAPESTVLHTYKIIKNVDSIDGKIVRDSVVYNISLYDNGNEIQPTGDVEVFVELPKGFGNNITVLRKDENGVWKEIDCTVEKGIIKFKVDHFCEFAICETNDCSCNCHKGGIKGFFFKFILFFQKIFRTNKTCKCGISHY